MFLIRLQKEDFVKAQQERNTGPLATTCFIAQAWKRYGWREPYAGTLYVAAQFDETEPRKEFWPIDSLNRDKQQKAINAHGIGPLGINAIDFPLDIWYDEAEYDD